MHDGASLAGERLDVRTARIRQPEDARDFIERLPRRVVERAAEHFELERGLRIDDRRMPAAREQRHKGRTKGLVLEIRRGEMPADVIDPDERDVEPVGKPLCKGQPHKERAQKPRPVGDGDGIELLLLDARRFEGASDDEIDGVRVGAGCDLGHDAPVERLDVGGGSDLIGQKPPARNDGGGGLIAGRFDPEDERLFFQHAR